MTDFYPLVLRALSKLDRDTEEDRQALYQRARATLASRLRKVDPPLSEQRIMAERLAFEEAVRRAEADWAQGLVERELLSRLADAIEHDQSLAESPQRTDQTWAHLSGTLRQDRSGARFEPTEGGIFGFAATGTQGDRATAADPLVRSIRAELESKARELAGRMSRISDQGQWRGLTDTVRVFAKRIGGSEAEVAADIGTLWTLCVALGTYVDSQETGSSRDILVPLEADLLRALRDLVAASGPWIGMFPTGRALDEETRAFGLPPTEIVDAAAAFLRSAAQAALLREVDATILRAVLDSGDAADLAHKAGRWAIHTASNLGIALLLGLAGIVRGYEKTGNAVEPSEVARRIEPVLLENEERLLLVCSQFPDDSRNALRMAIDAIRASAEDDV
jgi:hypothetical protein